MIALFAMSNHTDLSLATPVKVIGVSTPVAVKLANPHGVRRVSAYLEQNGARYPVYEESLPSKRLFWSRHEGPRTVTFEAGKNKAANLKEGKARLVVDTV